MRNFLVTLQFGTFGKLTLPPIQAIDKIDAIQKAYRAAFDGTVEVKISFVEEIFQ